MRRPFVAYRPLIHVLIVALTLQACAPRRVPSTVAVPAARATFVVDVPESEDSSGRVAGIRHPACLHATRFEGVVIPGSNDARVLISPAYVNVERHNDKYRDMLIMRVEVAEPRHALGTGSILEYRLGPTVDTAGPSLTTWQARDTLRLVVPWAPRIGARWLMFYVRYLATSYDGKASECSAILRSDTLRFGSIGSIGGP